MALMMMSVMTCRGSGMHSMAEYVARYTKVAMVPSSVHIGVLCSI